MNQTHLRHSRVLIADSDDNARQLSRVLKVIDNNYFTVELTRSRQRLMPALRSGEFDIFIVNWETVRTAGIEFLNELEKGRYVRSLIMLIGEIDEKVNRGILREKSVDCIVIEDFTVEKLSQAIDRILTEPTRQEDAVQENSAYSDLIGNLPVLSYSIEAKPPFSPIYVCPEFAAFGYPLEEWLNNADMWVRVLHPDDRERVFKETGDAISAGRRTNYNYRLITESGDVRWIHDQGGFAKAENGETLFWQAAMIDVTELKAAEILFLQNEGRYRQMFERSRSIKLLIDAETAGIVEANPAACEFYGYTAEEFKTKMFFDLDALRQTAVPSINSSFIGSNAENEFRHRLASGEERNVEVHPCPVSVEGLDQFYLIIYDITERKKAETALIRSEECFRDLFENAHDLVYVHDLDGNYLSVNKAAERLFGYSQEEAQQLNFSQIVVPEDLDFAREQVARKIAGTERSAFELDCFAKDGRRVSLDVSSHLVFENGEPVAVQGIARDITRRKLGDEALRESEERFRDLFENATDLIYTHDLDGNFTSLNRAGEAITGFTREEAMRVNIAEVVAPEYLEQARQMITRKVRGEAPTSYELDIITKDGGRKTLELSTRLIYRNDAAVGVQGIGRDITERKQAEAQLQQNALYDPLTKLPNRTHFMQHLRLAVERTEKESRYRFALLFLDLDRFKVINDSLGHAIGDKLLITISEQLKLCVRPSDIIARLGGDEFTILLAIRKERDAVRVAERIQRQLSVPFKVDNYEVFTSASIGIIVSGGIRRSPEEVLRDADSAMYRAKESGRARYEIFDHEMHVRNMTLLQLETDLRRAVERSEFEVYYQPIVDLQTGQIREFEALIRWNHPEQGLVSPDEFVSVAEETGLIIPIGEWILQRACRQVMEWQELSNNDERLSLSVNLSARQLMHPLLASHLRRILSETNLAPELLRIEVTESMVVEHGEAAVAVLAELQKAGVKLSTDDFGTGYSSLSYLHRFPFDRMKIDRSFIVKMDVDLKTEAIVRTILLLGQNLEIEVTAEGIENEQQLWQLRSLGCKRGQGYFFSKPVNAETATDLLKNGFPIDFHLMEEPFTFADTNSDPFVQIG